MTFIAIIKLPFKLGIIRFHAVELLHVIRYEPCIKCPFCGLKFYEITPAREHENGRTCLKRQREQAIKAHDMAKIAKLDADEQYRKERRHRDYLAMRQAKQS